MSATWILPDAGLDTLVEVAELVALKVRPGDVILLHGDLGAGKTTFCRALVRAVLGDPDAEVPSPTYPIVQTYETPRVDIAHFDLYRVSDPSELDEIGFHDALTKSLTIVEWPDRADTIPAADRIDVTLEETADPSTRHLTLSGHGTWGERLARLRTIHGFLAATIGVPARIAYLQGDASARAYARLAAADGAPFVLMDAPRMPDGPPILDGLPYSRIARLAEDVRPFVAIGRMLEERGLSVPHIANHDLDAGLLLLEDLGDLTFAKALTAGVPQAEPWLAAVDVLVALRRHPPARSLPLPDAGTYALPRFDRAALEIEIGLLLEWYWPAAFGVSPPQEVCEQFVAAWAPLLDAMLAAPPGLFLRDFHSPNLFWLPERSGIRRVGIIDFQDALAEHWAYDVASLLQDARLDVPVALEQMGLQRYCDAVAAFEPAFDREAFLKHYAVFGAQRNTRLVGLWVRLLRRDGKPAYLRHMPRTWDYLARNLAHPALAEVAAWFELHIPEAVRKRPISA